jgi:hypothetical protein
MRITPLLNTLHVSQTPFVLFLSSTAQGIGLTWTVCSVGCNSYRIAYPALYVMYLPDKEVCALVARFSCCRPADCQRAAGNHEYVKELSKQVFSKQQRVQVDEKLFSAL